MKALAVLSLLMLTACMEPTLDASVHAGPGGVTVSPVVHGSAGPVDVVVRP